VRGVGNTSTEDAPARMREIIALLKEGLDPHT
jgi:hypothetical protein